jgi:hypothetical protein
VQKKFRINLPWPVVRNRVALARRGLFVCLFIYLFVCLFVCSVHAFLYIFYSDLSTSYREAKNLTDLMLFEVSLINKIKCQAEHGTKRCAMGLRGITNSTLKWLRISSSSILCQYAQWQNVSLKITVNNAKCMRTDGKEFILLSLL